jgi:hypothetical protein
MKDAHIQAVSDLPDRVQTSFIVVSYKTDLANPGGNKFFINNLGFQYITSTPDAATTTRDKVDLALMLSVNALQSQWPHVCFFFLLSAPVNLTSSPK